MSGDARDFINKQMRAVINCFFPASENAKEIHAILTEILREHTPSYATFKNCVARFKRGDFSTPFCASSWTTQKSDLPGNY